MPDAAARWVVWWRAAQAGAQTAVATVAQVAVTMPVTGPGGGPVVAAMSATLMSCAQGEGTEGTRAGGRQLRRHHLPPAPAGRAPLTRIPCRRQQCTAGLLFRISSNACLQKCRCRGRLRRPNAFRRGLHCQLPCPAPAHDAGAGVDRVGRGRARGGRVGSDGGDAKASECGGAAAACEGQWHGWHGRV